MLAAAGAMAFGISIPISLATIGLLVILTLSYEQAIHAHPSGGGASIVALFLQTALLVKPGSVITNVPYQIH